MGAAGAVKFVRVAVIPSAGLLKVPVAFEKLPPQLEIHSYLNGEAGTGASTLTFMPETVLPPGMNEGTPVTATFMALSCEAHNIKLRNALCAATSSTVPLLCECPASYITFPRAGSPKPEP